MGGCLPRRTRMRLGDSTVCWSCDAVGSDHGRCSSLRLGPARLAGHRLQLRLGAHAVLLRMRPAMHRIALARLRLRVSVVLHGSRHA